MHPKPRISKRPGQQRMEFQLIERVNAADLLRLIRDKRGFRDARRGDAQKLIFVPVQSELLAPLGRLVASTLKNAGRIAGACVGPRPQVFPKKPARVLGRLRLLPYDSAEGV